MIISLNKYCPRSKYGISAQDIIQHVVQVESELNEEYRPSPIPKYEKKELKLTLASAVGMAGNCLKALIP